MSRCHRIMIRLGSRCVLEWPHKGPHMYPNALLRKERPGLWDDLQQAEQVDDKLIQSLNSSERIETDH